MELNPPTQIFNRAIEVAHIYFDDAMRYFEEEIAIPEFSHLSRWEFSHKDTLFVLVDDKQLSPIQTGRRWLIDKRISSYIFSEFGLPVTVVFESQFLHRQDALASYTVGKAGVRGFFNWANEVTKYLSGKKPNCFLLSLAWAKYRAERYDHVVTIIDKKYQSLERQVREFLPEGQKENYKLVWI